MYIYGYTVTYPTKYKRLPAAFLRSFLRGTHVTIRSNESFTMHIGFNVHLIPDANVRGQNRSACVALPLCPAALGVGISPKVSRLRDTVVGLLGSEDIHHPENVLPRNHQPIETPIGARFDPRPATKLTAVGRIPSSILGGYKRMPSFSTR